YEKGALFLRTLEEVFGRPVFDAFLRRRFDRLAFQSTDTATFEADVRSELIAKHPGVMSDATLASWLHDPGVPKGTVAMSSKRVGEIEGIATAFAAGTFFEDKGWSTLDWVI